VDREKEKEALAKGEGERTIALAERAHGDQGAPLLGFAKGLGCREEACQSISSKR